MTALDKTPSNLNLLSPLGFKFVVQKLPHVNFFVQNASIPGFTLPHVNRGTPFVNIPYAGDHIEYQPLHLTFKVDEDFQSYIELHSWLRGLGFPREFDEYANLLQQDRLGTMVGRNVLNTSGQGLYSDASLIILTNLKNANIEFTFKDTFPVSISQLNFETTPSDVVMVNCSVEFNYTLFEVAMIPK